MAVNLWRKRRTVFEQQSLGKKNVWFFYIACKMCLNGRCVTGCRITHVWKLEIYWSGGVVRASRVRWYFMPEPLDLSWPKIDKLISIQDDDDYYYYYRPMARYACHIMQLTQLTATVAFATAVTCPMLIPYASDFLTQATKFRDLTDRISLTNDQKGPNCTKTE